MERTRAKYEPDADMRRQIYAADVFSRALGSRIQATASEIHHVTPRPTGSTGELNLASPVHGFHQTKTSGLRTVVINEERDLTFTTLLGQSATTRSKTTGSTWTAPRRGHTTGPGQPAAVRHPGC